MVPQEEIGFLIHGNEDLSGAQAVLVFLSAAVCEGDGNGDRSAVDLVNSFVVALFWIFICAPKLPGNGHAKIHVFIVGALVGCSRDYGVLIVADIAVIFRISDINGIVFLKVFDIAIYCLFIVRITAIDRNCCI